MSANLPSQACIADIRIGKRHRKDLGDIPSLAESIQSVGLLHPVVIRPDGTLIAGERRLQACTSLGWTKIQVNVVPIDQIAVGELHENAHRKDFLPSEIDAIRRVVEPVERALAKEHQQKGGRGKKGAKISQPFRTTDKIGAFAGISGRQVEKIKAVVEAAKAEPHRFGHLMEVLDRPQGVSKAYHALRRARDEQRVLTLEPQPGKFRTIVMDPPWEYDDDLLGRGGVPYATMQREKVLALPVPAWAEDECHLYLWTTNAILPLAVECMARWGFDHKTVLTWVKPRFGMGTFFRGSTEHVLFGTRGQLMTRSRSIPTHFEAPVGAHSEKPERFYEIVCEASFLPVGEAFQRKARDGFVNLFGNRPKAAA